VYVLTLFAEREEKRSVELIFGVKVKITNVNRGRILQAKTLARQHFMNA
jgi:hypothetical protein